MEWLLCACVTGRTVQISKVTGTQAYLTYVNLVLRNKIEKQFSFYNFICLNLKSDDFCRVIDTAAAQLTKTAIAVTAIFIITMGYDNCHYVLGYTGVLTYKMNSPFQKIGTLFLQNINF